VEVEWKREKGESTRWMNKVHYICVCTCYGETPYSIQFNRQHKKEASSHEYPVSQCVLLEHLMDIS
jgi:hypothetical protein